MPQPSDPHQPSNPEIYPGETGTVSIAPAEADGSSFSGKWIIRNPQSLIAGDSAERNGWRVRSGSVWTVSVPDYALPGRDYRLQIFLSEERTREASVSGFFDVVSKDLRQRPASKILSA